MNTKHCYSAIQRFWPKRLSGRPLLLAFSTPEDIDDGPDTAPSKRIGGVYPAYRKVIDGELAARKIGIDKMRIECPHFNAWLKRLERLPELP